MDTERATPEGVASSEGLGLLPLSPHDHPEPQVMVWSELEMRAIRRYAAACVAAERERAALVCDDEARIRSEAGAKWPEFSEERARCCAAARAAINCAKGVRNGEVV